MWALAVELVLSRRVRVDDQQEQVTGESHSVMFA